MSTRTLPKGWTEVALGDVCAVQRDSVSPESIESGTTYVGLEHIGSDGRFIDPPIVQAGDLASQKFRFRPDHVLYGKLRPYLAKIAAPDFEGVCSTDILPLRPSSTVDRRYLLHHLRRPETVNQANGLSSGANLPRLSPTNLVQMRMPLPPIEEQRRIAAVLDQADELRTKRRAALVLIDTLKESLFFEMFGDPVTNPMGWPEEQVLGQVAEIGSGITKGRKEPAEPTRSVPYLAVANVQDQRLLLDAIKTIEASEKEIARYRLRPGDLLLTEGGDPDKLGRGTIWNDELPECIHQNHIFRVRLEDDRLTPRFLNLLLASQRGKRFFLRRAKQTTGIASINKTQLSEFPLLVPPVELQHEFSDRLDSAAAVGHGTATSKMRLDDLFASLHQRAFRGEL